eukprot:TRINITY_DN3212_c0_g1_i7.p1 TRINITY_DN3212_c0_g1~~TRINITY_DN3212_c0_g1_i7.p1  ORF type:complete len:474 (-),score=88.44 TRINITY_DN3212_c0_g1_i7:114-1535(-)
MIARWHDVHCQGSLVPIMEPEPALDIPPVRSPGAFLSLWILLRRDVLRRRRAVPDAVSNCIQFALSGLAVGLVTGDTSTDVIDPVLGVFFNLMAMSAVIGTFRDNKLICWREIASGYSPFAVFVSQSLLDLPYLCLYSAFFWILYLHFCTPLASAGVVYVALALQAWASGGMVYMFTIYFEQPLVPGVMCALILNLFFSGNFQGLYLAELEGSPLAAVFYLSPTRWGNEMIFVSSGSVFPDSVDAVSEMREYGWSESDTGNDNWRMVWPLLLLSLFYRVVSFIGFVWIDRGRMAKRPLLTEVRSLCGLDAEEDTSGSPHPALRTPDSEHFHAQAAEVMANVLPVTPSGLSSWTAVVELSDDEWEARLLADAFAAWSNRRDDKGAFVCRQMGLCLNGNTVTGEEARSCPTVMVREPHVFPGESTPSPPKAHSAQQQKSDDSSMRARGASVYKPDRVNETMIPGGRDRREYGGGF